MPTAHAQRTTAVNHPPLPTVQLSSSGGDGFWNQSRILLSLLMVVALFLGFGLGGRPLANPDEGRYCEIPREMIERSDWVTPHLNGLKYFEKPPLVYWLQATVMSNFGDSDAMLRLVPMLFALFGCMITFFAAAQWYGRRCGVIAVAVLVTSPLYYGLSRMVILDMVASVLIVGAIFSMVHGLVYPAPSRRSTAMILVSFAFCAFATLAKGMIGFLIPGAVVALWIVALREWHWLRRALNPFGIILFLLIAAPWHVLVALKNPEFVDFYFIREHVLRLTTTMHARYQPVWFFIPVVFAGFFPWIVFLPKALKDLFSRQGEGDAGGRTHNTPETQIRGALILTVAVVFGVFSLSQSKLIPYILPIFPPLAILVARLLDRSLAKAPSFSRASFRTHILMAALVAVILALTGLWGVQDARHLNSAELMRPVLLLGGLLVSTVVIGWCVFEKRGVRAGIIALVAGMMAFLIALNQHSVRLQKPSTKDVALAILEHHAHAPGFKGDAPPHTVVAFHDYPQDLPFYLKQTVTVVGWLGELSFGREQNPACDWMIDDDTFWTQWTDSTRARLYVVVPTSQWATFQAEASRRRPHKIFHTVPGYIVVTPDES